MTSGTDESKTNKTKHSGQATAKVLNGFVILQRTRFLHPVAILGYTFLSHCSKCLIVNRPTYFCQRTVSPVTSMFCFPLDLEFSLH